MRCPDERRWTSSGNNKRLPDTLDETKLRDALTVRERRRVRRDTTVSVLGKDYELDQGFLAGRLVTLAYSLLDGLPWIEHEGHRLELHEVDPVQNARRKRLPRRPGAATPTARTPFDPAKALLDAATGHRKEDDT